MNESNSKSSKKIFQFGTLATILGFVVDTIAIISILLSLNLPDSGFVLPKYVLTPGFALGIWTIATYVYFAILHSYWEKSNEGNSFKEFITGLLFRFSNPFALLPGIVLLVLLIWIIVVEPVILGILFAVFIFSVMVAASFYDTFGGDIERKKAKKLIDQNWSSLKKTDKTKNG